MHRFLSLLLTLVALGGAAACSGTPSKPCENEAPAVSIRTTPVQYANVNGVRLGYREFGTGPSLLVIVGYGVTMEQANDTAIGIFASKYRVILYDHRGMGHSGPSSAAPTIGQFADDAAGLLQALGCDSVHVYGTSMGSFVAQELAFQHPARVGKLILDSSSYSIRLPETQDLLNHLEAAAVAPATPPGQRDEARAMLAWGGTWERLPSLEKDVLLVVGTADTITPEVLSLRMAGQIRNAWLIRFKGLPHAGGGVAPEAYGRAALHFLGTTPSTCPRS